MNWSSYREKNEKQLNFSEVCASIDLQTLRRKNQKFISCSLFKQIYVVSESFTASDTGTHSAKKGGLARAGTVKYKECRRPCVSAGNFRCGGTEQLHNSCDNKVLHEYPANQF